MEGRTTTPELPELPELTITEKMVFEFPELKDEYWNQRLDHALAGESILIQTFFSAGGNVFEYWADKEQQGQIIQYPDNKHYVYTLGVKRVKAGAKPFDNLETATGFLEDLTEYRLSRPKY